MRLSPTRTALASLALFLPLALTACVVHVKKGSGSDTSKPNTDGSDADEAKPDTATETTPEGDADSDPARAEAPSLAECPAEAPEGGANYCTEDGKLAAFSGPVDRVKVPESAEKLFYQEGTDTERKTYLAISAVGETLYIRHVTCENCRRVLGKGYTAHLDHMSEEQVKALQAELGLDAEMAALTTAAAWKDFASNERGMGTLVGLAAKAEGEL